MNIGIIGGGAIAQFLLKQDLRVKSILIRDLERYQFLAENYGVKLFTELEAFLNSGIDLVLEAANIEAVKAYMPRILKNMDALVISIGAFSDQEFAGEIYKTLEKFNRQLHLPAGAIGGLDLLQNAASLGGLEEVLISTRKPAHTLVEEDLDQEKIIFSGSAEEAIKRFPKNVNVSIVLSLAGIGPEKTRVELIADPNIHRNKHSISIKGDFGSAKVELANNPMEDNPKTSYLAALSVLGSLKRLQNPLKIG